jgi:hypothetical protein
MQLASFKHSWSYNFEMSPRYLETSCTADLRKLRIILNTVHTISEVANVKAGSTDSNQCASEVPQTRHVKHRRTMFLLLTIQPVTACAPYQHSWCQTANETWSNKSCTWRSAVDSKGMTSQTIGVGHVSSDSLSHSPARARARPHAHV